jgi:predicted acyltransferase
MLTNKSSPSLVTTLIGAAVLLTAAGLLLDTWMPINKKLWTSTYVLLTSGLALAVLALLIESIERRREISRPLETGWRACEAFGRNALFIFALSGLVPRMLSLIRLEDGSNEDGTVTYINLLSFIHREFFARLADDPRFGSLLYAITTLLAYWAIAAFMQRQNWYIKV